MDVKFWWFTGDGSEILTKYLPGSKNSPLASGVSDTHVLKILEHASVLMQISM